MREFLKVLWFFLMHFINYVTPWWERKEDDSIKDLATVQDEVGFKIHSNEECCLLGKFLNILSLKSFSADTCRSLNYAIFFYLFSSATNRSSVHNFTSKHSSQISIKVNFPQISHNFPLAKFSSVSKTRN